MKNTSNAIQMERDEHCQSGNAKKVLSGILVPPTSLGSGDPGSAPIQVGANNLVRLFVSAAVYIAFGADAPSLSGANVPGAATPNGLYLNAAGVYLVATTGPFLGASAAGAITRTEIIAG